MKSLVYRASGYQGDTSSNKGQPASGGGKAFTAAMQCEGTEASAAYDRSCSRGELAHHATSVILSAAHATARNIRD